MLAYRSSVHETTKETPFKLMFEREVRLPVDVMFGHPAPFPAVAFSMWKILEKHWKVHTKE